ncbi:hypothetical protein V492_06643 [Pseudogymnoascus sp. VKM F-4246]|nr:hypothetical protein V492_06643 [Pseudogymnoascus sp. VKM F-4246]
MCWFNFVIDSSCKARIYERTRSSLSSIGLSEIWELPLLTFVDPSALSHLVATIMRISLVLSLSYLSVAVWAGGYQGCLERVWLFQAYEIDALNPLADQTIGFKCTKADEKKKECTGVWTACRPGATTGRTRCDFGELMKHLGKAPTVKKGDAWVGLDDKGNLDSEKTAKNCYRIFSTSDARNKNVKNFPPYTAMRDTWEYNEYIMKISTKVNDAYRTHKTEANKHLWERFDDTRAKISVARAADHGPYLIEAAKDKFGPDLPLSRQDLGINPVTGMPQETVDWKMTALQAKVKGIRNANTDILRFLQDFYSGSDKHARDHAQVIRSYKRVADRSQSCRRRS